MSFARSFCSWLGSTVAGTGISAAVRFGLPPILNVAKATFPEVGIITTAVVGGITGFVAAGASQTITAFTRSEPKAWTCGSFAKTLSILNVGFAVGAGVALAMTYSACAFATDGYAFGGMPADVANMTANECLNNANTINPNPNALGITTWAAAAGFSMFGGWAAKKIADRCCSTPTPRQGYTMLTA